MIDFRTTLLAAAISIPTLHVASAAAESEKMETPATETESKEAPPSDVPSTEAKSTEAPAAKTEAEADAEAASTEASEKWESEARQAALKVQLFLDREGFGPGKIDGRWGGFSEKAAKRWNSAGRDMAIPIAEGGALDSAKAKEIPFEGELLTTYKVTEEDQSLLGTVPDEPSEQAKLEKLPYTSLMELVAEKFHADPDFIRELNGYASNDDVKAGAEVKVPNVAEPFDISEPMGLAKNGGEDAKDKESGTEAGSMEITVLREERVVEVRDSGKLIHSFPISPGAEDNQSPEGDWKVSGVTWMPDFRWDKSMLEDGKRSEDSFLLPPGPNNPVGIVWIALSADGIGLHGTPFPDAIGRNRSHGCIRLSNWDALKLGKTVKSGAAAIIK